MADLPNFASSSSAIDQLARLRGEYLAHSPDDPPELLGIFWGWPVDASGKPGEGQVAPAYWCRSEVTDAARAEVITVSGVDLIFSVLPQYRSQFEQRIVDYTLARGFFLRVP